jgi:hypothetical protein
MIPQTAFFVNRRIKIKKAERDLIDKTIGVGYNKKKIYGSGGAI